MPIPQGRWYVSWICGESLTCGHVLLENYLRTWSCFDLSVIENWFLNVSYKTHECIGTPCWIWTFIWSLWCGQAWAIFLRPPWHFRKLDGSQQKWIKNISYPTRKFRSSLYKPLFWPYQKTSIVFMFHYYLAEWALNCDVIWMMFLSIVWLQSNDVGFEFYYYTKFI